MAASPVNTVSPVPEVGDWVTAQYAHLFDRPSHGFAATVRKLDAAFRLGDVPLIDFPQFTRVYSYPTGTVFDIRVPCSIPGGPPRLWYGIVTAPTLIVCASEPRLSRTTEGGRGESLHWGVNLHVQFIRQYCGTWELDTASPHESNTDSRWWRDPNRLRLLPPEDGPAFEKALAAAMTAVRERHSRENHILAGVIHAAFARPAVAAAFGNVYDFDAIGTL